MLYGHIETRADRVNHMDILRRQQDRTLRDWAESHGIGLQHDDAVVLYGPDDMYPETRLPALDLT